MEVRESGIWREREYHKCGDVNNRILRGRERSLATTKEGKIENWRERGTRKYGAEE